IKKKYQLILDQLIGQDEERIRYLLKKFRNIVGTIVILVDPLPAALIASLLNISAEDVNIRLNSLHLVLHIPANDTPVKPLHISLRNFLLGSRTRDKTLLWLDKRATY
ncbi:uncharacterized protein BDR25DRAFT_222794, partial [Lindgomyces ingoldianus]